MGLNGFFRPRNTPLLTHDCEGWEEVPPWVNEKNAWLHRTRSNWFALSGTRQSKLRSQSSRLRNAAASNLFHKGLPFRMRADIWSGGNRYTQDIQPLPMPQIKASSTG